MTTYETVKEILHNAGQGNQPNPYKNVYFIKTLNPGDGISLFNSFRFKTTKQEVLLCRVNIDLALTTNNVSIAISLMKQPMIKRESITFFRQRHSIRGKSIIELLNGIVLDTFVEKIEKVEDYYKQESSNVN